MNKKVFVNCKVCSKQLYKEVFDLKKWQGNCKSCAKLGNKIGKGNKGRVIPQEIRDKISESNKGKPKFYMKGEKNWNWKGGITEENNKIRSSLEYKIWRRLVFERDNYTCIWCGDNKGGNLNADHIKPFIYYPELRFDVDNGRTLCIQCHKNTDTYGTKVFNYLEVNN